MRWMAPVPRSPPTARLRHGRRLRAFIGPRPHHTRPAAGCQPYRRGPRHPEASGDASVCPDAGAADPATCPAPALHHRSWTCDQPVVLCHLRCGWCSRRARPTSPRRIKPRSRTLARADPGAGGPTASVSSLMPRQAGRSVDRASAVIVAWPGGSLGAAGQRGSVGGRFTCERWVRLRRTARRTGSN